MPSSMPLFFSGLSRVESSITPPNKKTFSRKKTCKRTSRTNNLHLRHMIYWHYSTTAVHDLHLSGRTDTYPDLYDLYDLYDLVHLVGWKLYNLPDLL